MPIFNNVLAGAAGQSGGAAGFKIERSLRFNDADQSNLNRTPSAAGNRKTFTWSGWTKRSELGGTQRLMFVGPGSNYFSISFNNDQIQVEEAGGSNSFYVYTNAVFRDPSAWYHVVIAVDTTQATQTNRVKVYVNGVDQALTAGNNWPPPNAVLQINNTVDHRIGRNDADCFNGFLAECILIDGQALAPTDFGETNTDNLWVPIAYAGTYGTNGFHLDFSDNSSKAALGTDSSGKSNTWTVNYLSVASGAGNDSLIDSPTNYEASGNNGGNYATLNPLAISPNATPTLSNGNLEIERTASGGQWTSCGSTFALSSGKWYWELKLPTINGTIARWGVADADDYEFNRDTSGTGLPWLGSGTGTSWSMDVGGNTYHNGSTVSSSYTSTVTTNDVIGVALDCDANTLTFYKNGSSLGIAHSSVSASRLVPAVGLHTGTHNKVIINFGQRPFAHTPPTGFKSLCTKNLDNPPIADGSTAMDIKTYDGNGSNTNTISGLSFSPDLVWIKRMDDPGHHAWYDEVRGQYKHIGSSHTNVEKTEPTGRGLSAFNSDGFTINTSNGDHTGSGNVNVNNAEYAAWTWDAGSTFSNSAGTNGASIASTGRANTSAGFSILTYTGTSSGGSGSIAHGLNAAPDFIIFKTLDVASENWAIYHSSMGLAYGEFTTTDFGGGNATNRWSQLPTSSLIHLGSDTNINTKSHLMYAWSSVEGYSSFGKFTGNGSTDGPFIYTGFKVKWLLTKRSDGGSNDWQLVDATRSPLNVADDALKPNSVNAEGTHADYGVDFLSNGFKQRTDHIARNGSGNTYVYAAFAEHPFKTARAR